jgi:hypothetical protein
VTGIELSKFFESERKPNRAGRGCRVRPQRPSAAAPDRNLAIVEERPLRIAEKGMNQESRDD